MLLNKHGLNAERGLPSPLCALPMQLYALPIALSTVWGRPERAVLSLSKKPC